jgi:hypothetical protein
MVFMDKGVDIPIGAVIAVPLPLVCLITVDMVG